LGKNKKIVLLVCFAKWCTFLAVFIWGKKDDCLLVCFEKNGKLFFVFIFHKQARPACVGLKTAENGRAKILQ